MFTKRNWVTALTVTAYVTIVMLCVHSFFLNYRPDSHTSSLFLKLVQFENSSRIPASIKNGNKAKVIKKLVDPCDYQRPLDKYVNQEDPCLVATVRKMLIPPPPSDERSPQNLAFQSFSLEQKFLWVKKLLVERQGIRKGFFVELGANNGEIDSPTMYIENKLNWTGLLVEPTEEFQKLIQRKRNVWAINVAASKHPYPESVTFSYNPKISLVSGFRDKGWGKDVKMRVQCLPLYTMLKAINQTDVDYLSLDVEGFGLAVLKTLPWEKVSFKMITSEYHNIQEGGLPALTAFLDGKGYKVIRAFFGSSTHDALFVNEFLYEDARAINGTIFA